MSAFAAGLGLASFLATQSVMAVPASDPAIAELLRSMPPELGVTAESLPPRVAAEVSSRRDQEPPLVFVLPAETPSAPDRFELVARVTDVSGVGKVTAWIRDDSDGHYRELTMDRRGSEPDTYRVAVPEPIQAGQSLRFYVSATDRLDNGPALGGSADSPFVIRGEFKDATDAASGRQSMAISAVVLAFLVAVLWVRIGWLRRNEANERRFWTRLVEPLLAYHGRELRSAIQTLCASQQMHPQRGPIRVHREDVLYWVGVIRNETHPADGAPPPRALTTPRTRKRTPHDEEQRKLAVEMFWLQLLAPAMEMTGQAVQRELDRLSEEPHAHPIDGLQRFDRRTLADRLEWARSICPYEVLDRWKSVHLSSSASPGPARQPQVAAPSLGNARGMSFVELITVLAILTSAALMTGLMLRPVEAPVRTGGQLLEAAFKQARARAMATTSAFRVRPLSSSSLAVETAASCGAGAWTLDPTIDVEFPNGVFLTETAWTVCFNSRGTASENLTFTINHPDHDSRQIELLLGGVVTWQ